MSTASKVLVANIALTYLGAARITDFTDKKESAILANTFFNQARDEVLRLHDWNSAIKRYSVAEDATAPAFEFNHQYKIPSDCLRVIRLEFVRAVYRIEGRKILTDETAPLNFLGIQKVDDMNSLDPLLRDVIAINLARLLAQRLTGGRLQIAKMDALLEKKMSDARFYDASESSVRELFAEEFIDAHQGLENNDLIRKIKLP